MNISYQGFSTTVIDPDNNRKTEKKDCLGRIIEVVEYPHDNEEYHTTYQYNAAGDLLKVTDALNNQTNLTYDTLGRKRVMVDPDMGRWEYTYDPNGNLLTQKDAKNQEIRFEYDVLNRVLNKQYFIAGLASSVDSPVIYTYDNTTAGNNGIGKPYTVTKGNVVLTNNKYDSLGRGLKVTKAIDGVDYVTQNTYDLSGKVKKLTYPDNYFITYVYYPGTNLIESITDSANIVQAVYTDYEPTGKIGQIDYHNNTATKYTYDAWSTKLFGIVTEDPTRDPQKLLQDREYTYSRAGDILRIVDHVQKVTYDYAYDKLHRLIAEKLSGTNAPIATKVETITLDYTGTGPVHGVKTIDLNGVSRTCAYDANGNMITSPDFTNGANPLNRAITYDGDNMPTRIVHANGATVDFVYDGVGKRTKKLVASGKTVLYLGDHFEVENGVNIKYIFGGNLRLAQIKGSLTSYFHKDHLGSTAAVTDEAGQKKESTTYEPFGSTRTQEGTAVSAYKFTDQELDNETNLYNYDARLYDPVIGKFGTADNIVQNWYAPQSLNAYAYCRNNPLIYTDPTGHITTGEQLEKWALNAIGSDNAFTSYVGGYSLTFVSTAWTWLGAEATSKVYDNLVANPNRNDMTGTDAAFATVEVATALLPGVGKLLSKGGKVAEVGLESAEKGLSKLAKEGVETAAESICFAAGTKIHTQDGLKPIEEIGIGDKVLSRNELTGETDYRKVLRTFVTPDQDILEINILTSDGKTESFKVTGAHPFYEKAKSWIEAENLLPDDEVFTSAGGWLQVSGSTWLSERQTVYNFEVDGFHTYFVGESVLWVHNSCAPGNASKAFSAEKNALVEMAKQDAKKGITKADMEAYKDLNKQLKDPFPSNKVRLDLGHPSRAPHSQVPHGHVGPVKHIPII